MHCDIKEANLMLKTTNYHEPEVVVIDLGVSTCMAARSDGIPHGTPGYIPPEVLRQRRWFPRGDVFSLGVSICQIMLDRKPGAGIFQEGCADVKDILRATIQREPPLDELDGLGRPQLKDLIAQLLEKDRMARPTAPQALNAPWFKNPNDDDDGD